jgi:hypothetical protein
MRVFKVLRLCLSDDGTVEVFVADLLGELDLNSTNSGR